MGKKVYPELSNTKYALQGDRWDKDLNFVPTQWGWPRMDVDVDDIGPGEDCTAVMASAFFAVCASKYEKLMADELFRRAVQKKGREFYSATGLDDHYEEEEL